VTRYRTIVADPPWDHSDAPLGRQRAAGREDFLPYPAMSVATIAAIPVTALAVPGAHIYLWTTNRFLWDAPSVLKAWGFEPATTIVWCKKPMGLGGGSAAFANTTEFVVWGRKRFGAEIAAARQALDISPADLERKVRALIPSLPAVRSRGDTGLVARWEDDSAWPTPEHIDALSTIFGWNPEAFAGAPSKRWHTTWFGWKRAAHSAKPEAFLDLVEETSPGPYLELFARRNRLGWDTWGNEALEHVELGA
jgi:N6-adenosine-specific RNA methylase IME4